MKTIQPSMVNLRSLALIGALAWSAAATSAADYATTLSSLNPVGYWRLNEPAQPVVPTYPMANSSATGSALDGLYYGVPTLQADGAVSADKAASFSGNLQYAEIPYTAALNPTGPFSVEFWARLTNDTGGAKSGVVSRYVTVPGGPTGQFGYLFFCNNNLATYPWQFRVYNGTAATTINDAVIGDVQPDTWYHVVGVYDGANAHIYVNGQKSSTTSGTVVYAPNTNAPTRIGAGTPETTPSLFFPGQLDNVAVYHSVLTDAQVQAHYDAATSNPGGYNALVLADNPAAYYVMNEAALPPYVPYAATNSGTLGSALDGAYSLAGSSSGVAGPARDQFAGFATDNKSVRLNASGAAGRVTLPPVTGMTTDHATITCWVRRAGSQVDTAPMYFNEAPSGGAASLNFQYQTRNLAYHWESGSKWAWTSGLLVPDDLWTFVALVVTPTNAVMYMGSTNGLTNRINTAAHDIHDFSSTVAVLGTQFSRSDRYLKGWLDEVALLDYPLDYTQVSNLFYSATPAIPLVTRTADPLYEGMTVNFTAYGVAAGPVNYQWRKDGANLNGKTSSTLALSNVITNDSGNYDVVVTYGANSVTSAVSAITVVAGPPIIAKQPASATRYAGAAVTFSVEVQGSKPWSYQWKQGSSAIAGATDSSYTIPVLKAADAGSYSVTISNPLGATNSASATLTVLPVDNYAAQVAYSGAGAYWQMNEKAGTSAMDYVGGMTCNIVGAVTNNVASVRPPTYAGYNATNTCFAFAGESSDYLTTPAALNFTNTSITMAAWVMPYSGLLAVASDVNFVGSVGSGFGLNAAGADGKVRAHPLWGADAGMSFSFDTWNYVVVIWTPGGQTFYLDNGDGGGLRSSSVSGTVDPSLWKSGPFFIGRQASRTDRGWPGQIDELALWDRALTPAEVTNLYLAAISGPTAPSIIAQPVSRTVLAGQTVSFTVGEFGAAPMTYQWKHAGTNLPGGTTKVLTIPNAYYTDAGTYQVIVANGIGSPVSSATATLTVEPPPTFAYLTNNLVLHLRFDGDFADSSGRTNHAEAKNTPEFVAGRIGTQAVQVNTDKDAGVYNYVQLWDANLNAAYPDLVFTEADSFSVAFWVKYADVAGDLPIIGNVANSTYNRGWVFAENFGSKLVWTAHGDVGAVDADGIGPVIKDGTWHHVVTSFDRATRQALTYIDGVQVDDRSIEGLGNLDSGYAVCIGQDPTGYYGQNGTYVIDDVGLWRRALTPGEAAGIHAAGLIGQSFDVVGPGSLTFKKSGGELELIWQQGTLQSADDVAGPYSVVNGAVAPYHKVAPATGKKFYRVKF